MTEWGGVVLVAVRKLACAPLVLCNNAGAKTLRCQSRFTRPPHH